MTTKSTPKSLVEALSAALPGDSLGKVGASPLEPGFRGKIRYLHTPPKPCDPLFSPPPGHEPEKTRLASHFLTVSISPLHTTEGRINTTPYLEQQQEGVLGIGLEVLVYSTKHLTKLFVSKADTSGYISSTPPSKTKAICTTFIQWLAEQERRKHPSRTVVVSLFARAQSQYLFPGSAEHNRKNVLSDRQLIKWWAKVLDPILDPVVDGNDPPEVTGYLTIPGYGTKELRTYLPRTQHANGNSWKPGHPLNQLGEARGVAADAPPRSLLPRFPDDPKARYMQDLDDEVGLSEEAKTTASPSKRKSGRWKNVRDLDRFWEAMEFRQECSSGRVVGFLWVVMPPQAGAAVANGNAEAAEEGASQSQDSSLGLLSSDAATGREATPTPSAPSTTSSPAKKRKRKVLSGPIISRQPRLKVGSSSLTATSSSLNGMLNAPAGDGLLVTKDGYDKAMHCLLHLDFANLEAAARSTNKYVTEVASICGLAGDWGREVVGTAPSQPEPKTTNINGNRRVATANDLGGMVRKKRKAGIDDQVAPQTDAAVVESKDAINVLDAGSIRKKSKTVNPLDSAVAQGHAVAETREETARTEMPAVNVLGGGLVRKKVKPMQ